MITTEKPNPNTRIIWVSAILAAGFVLMTFLYFSQRTTIRLVEPVQRDKSAQHGIDTLTVRRTGALIDATDYSAVQASKSKIIIKNLKQKSNEKIIIRDTAYAAMCEYIASY